MRIVTTACLVLAILFMVGCQQLTEKQKADLDKVSSIEAKLSKVETEYNKAVADPNEGLAKKVAEIEAFLKDKLKYGAPPPEVKKEEPKKGAKPAAKEEPKKEEPKKEPPAKKEPGKTK